MQISFSNSSRIGLLHIKTSFFHATSGYVNKIFLCYKLIEITVGLQKQLNSTEI